MPTGELSGVSVLLLALLCERPMHPYEAFGLIEERHDTRLVRVTAGAVYHGFERLERDGLVRPERTDRQGGRPERTTYAITDAGRDALSGRVRSLLADDHPAYPLLAVGIAEAEALPAAEVVEALRERLRRDGEWLDQLRDAHQRLSARGLERRHMLDVEYEVAMLDAQNRWLAGVVDELVDGSLPWNPDPWPAPSARPGTDPHLTSDDVAHPTNPRSTR
ncbi:PadR family transcriptional regulator [Cellulomonas citrea]|uniref:PadR family transcriptional regulator n=1 Tax=Cellulomonas citrea TaxID=1909423 RepID=UPI0013569A4F|nr:PadR family transcriptional regulator [Cellulomonas citrea]